jgi:hypothetical protein
MSKIQWERLPRGKWAHLRDRAKERQISKEDLFDPAEWKAQDPDVPDGDWYKDFGTHAGLEGRLPEPRGEGPASPIDFGSYRWRRHCRGLYQTPIAA